MTVQRDDLWTAKRRVAARIHLADDHPLEGSLYADTLRVDGLPATIADRLNDPLEQYVPLAIENRHVLLNKSRVVVVQVALSAIERPATEGLRVLPVTFRMTNGAVLEGTLRVYLPAARSRLLDYMNMVTQPFITLFDDVDVTFVNSSYIVGVTEVAEGAGQA